MARNAKGHFAKGNQVAKGRRYPDEMKDKQNLCREKLSNIGIALMIENRDELIKRYRKDGTAFEVFIANAIGKNNSKVITWLYDQIIGRPKQVDIDNAQRPIEIKLSYDPNAPRPAVNYPDENKIDYQYKIEGKNGEEN